MKIQTHLRNIHTNRAYRQGTPGFLNEKDIQEFARNIISEFMIIPGYLDDKHDLYEYFSNAFGFS
jgi:hypothetical protein